MFKVSTFYKHIFINLFLAIISILSIIFALFISNKFLVSRNSLNDSYINQSQDIANSIDYKLKSGINLINKASVNELSIDYTSLKEFNPVINSNLYKYLSSSASLIYDIELVTGVYNDQLDLLITNEASDSSTSFLKKYKLNNDKSSLSLFDKNLLAKDYSQTTKLLGFNDDSKHLFYSIRKTHLPNEPLFIIVYSLDSLTREIKSNPSIADFKINYADSTQDDYKLNKNDNTITINSDVVPISYTLKFNALEPVIPFTSIVKILFVFIIIILISLVLIYRFSNKMYTPVKRLISYAKDPNDSEPILDEFEYIRQQVDTLKNTISSYEVSNKYILLKEILYGIEKKDPIKLLNENNIELFSNKCFMVIFNLKDNIKSSFDAQTLQSYVELSLIRDFDHLVQYKDYKFINITSSSNILLVSSVSRTDIKSIFAKNKTLANNYNIIVSDYVTPEQSSTKLKYISDLIKNKKIHNLDNILLEEEIIILPETPYLFSMSDREVLSYNILNGNKNKTLSLLNKILDENLYKRKLKPQVYKEFISALCSTIIDISDTLIPNDDLFILLMSIDDKDELKDTTNSIFIKLIEHVNFENNSNNDNYNFLQYIHENYDKDISLDHMASEFNLAKNYVGVLFKENTGHNFKDYLNKHRINVSKQILLETPSITIKDLAPKVGFLNTTTFTRVFKRHENMTPGQYKKYILDTKPTK